MSRTMSLSMSQTMPFARLGLARMAAFAALALGASALASPAEAQHRYGVSGEGYRYADTRAPYHPRGHAPRWEGRRYAPPGYRAPRNIWGGRPAHPVYRSRGHNYWPVAAGVGLGVVAGAAIANSRPRYVQQTYYPADPYYTTARYPNPYPTQCWLEQRTVRSGFDQRVMTVRVCPQY